MTKRGGRVMSPFPLGSGWIDAKEMAMMHITRSLHSRPIIYMYRDLRHRRDYHHQAPLFLYSFSPLVL